MMTQTMRQLRITISLLIYYLIEIVNPVSLQAQITPDASLTTKVTTSDGLNFTVTGNTRFGGNLFHSFRDFSVPTGGSVFFNNPVDIQHIISRITGSSISNIDGLIKANGLANLFLINPNGMIFGKNAALDIGGSFIASTANTIKLADGTQFSAIAPEQTSALLNINVPMGLGYGSNPGRIVNQSRAIDSNGQMVGLQVLPSKTIALVGGEVRLEGGNLQAPGGRVELGGLSSSGTVRLNWDNNNLSLSFPDSIARADASLTNGATLDVRGGAGSMAINLQNLYLAQGSRLLAGIKSGVSTPGNRAGNIEINAIGSISFDGAGNDGESGAYNLVESNATGQGGSINITADALYLTNGGLIKASTLGQGNAGDVNLHISNASSFDNVSSHDGISSGIYSRVEANKAIGNGGNISLTTGSLSLTNGGLISASTQGHGNAGNITISVRNQTILDGEGPLVLVEGSIPSQQSSGLYSSVKLTGVGNGGNINLTTGSLLVTNGALVIVRTEGQGRAGNIVLNVGDFVNVDGVGSDLSSSGLFASTESKATGQGGDITVTTNNFRVSNGAVVNAQTLTNSNGGNITINTKRFEAIGGGQLISSTGKSGRAGNVIINAADNILLSGSDPNFTQRSPLFSTNIVGNNEGSSTGLFANTDKDSTGVGGNLTIQAGQFTIQNGAQASVSADGSGSAGNLKVTADSISLDHGGLAANTSAGNFGNILLKVQSLQLRRNSQITTNATGAATGGNINIDTGVLAALENSDITANSQQSFGGQVKINTQGIFRQGFINGTTVNQIASPQTSDITATSTLGPQFNGTVTIQTPRINPSQGLVALSQRFELSDIPQGCEVAGQSTIGKRGSSFVKTGLGGVPPSPNDALNSDRFWDDFRPVKLDNSVVSLPRQQVTKSVPIEEATGWLVNKKGQVVLITQIPNTTPESSWLSPGGCSPVSRH